MCVFVCCSTVFISFNLDARNITQDKRPLFKPKQEHKKSEQINNNNEQ